MSRKLEFIRAARVYYICYIAQSWLEWLEFARMARVGPRVPAGREERVAKVGYNG